MKNKWLVSTLLIWAIVFCVPKFRYLLQTMAEGSSSIQFTLVRSNWDTYFGSDSPELPIQVAAVKGIDSLFWGKDFATLDKLDQLINKNPKQAWLIALRLRMAMTVLKGDRIGGEYSDGKRKEHIRAGIPSPESNGEKPNFTLQQIEQTLALCRIGEQLEPQNAFFSWARCYFLLMNWQDEKAWQALDIAAAKSYWNNHDYDFKMLFAHSMEKVLGRKLSPFEKLSAPLSSTRIYTGGRLEEMFRIIAWESLKLKRQQKHQTALRIMGSYYQTMSLAAQGASEATDFMTAYRMQSLIAASATAPSRDEIESGHKTKRTREQVINGFIAYAQNNGRPDLALQINNTYQTNSGIFQALSKKIRQSSRDFPHFMSLLQLNSVFFVLCIVIILTAIGGLIAWFTTKCYRWFFGDKSTFNHTVHPGEIGGGILVCSGIPSLVEGTLWILILSSIFCAIDPSHHLNNLLSGWDISRAIHSKDPFIKAFPEFVAGLMSTPFPLHQRILLLFTPFVSGAIYALFSTKENLLTWRSPFLRQVWKTGLFTSLLFSLWGVLVLTQEYGTLQIIAACICTAFLAVSGFLKMRAFPKINKAYSLQLFQSCLTGWVCMASILVLVLLIGQTVLDNRLQPWADNYLRGEMHLLHQVKDAPPQNH